MLKSYLTNIYGVIKMNKIETRLNTEENNERYNPNINDGLNEEQIQARKLQNLINYDTTVPTKSIKSIIINNFFTLFNLMNLLLAIAVFSVGEYKNMLFIILVVINTAISTVQEIHSKKIIDKLSLISSAKVHCVRNGNKQDIGINEVVLDDILLFEAGNQVITDCILLDGEIEVNESFITGESDSIIKKKGDLILSGSFVVSGKCVAKVEHIGEENFTSKISKETRYIKKVKSEIMTSLNKIIRTVSIIIIPVGTLLFFNQLGLEDGNIRSAVVHTVAAIIGMIPEGLILLTSTVLAVSVIRLSKSNVLVQELFCIETLARVDTLCLDKTGTITEGRMEVNDIITENIELNEMQEILSAIGKNSEDSNSTIEAIRDKYKNIKLKGEWEKTKTVPFSSKKKWSGVEFKQKGSYIIGAPEFVLKDTIENYKNDIEKYSADYRVLVLAHSKENIKWY
jgi:cation-transporting P-type ATPase E